MHYVFDVDGVLLKPWVWRDHLIMEYGLLPEQTQEFFNGPFLDCIVGKADLYQVLEPFLIGWGFSLSTKEFVDLWLETDSEVIESTFNFIEEISAGADSLSIATNQEAYRSRHLWENVGLKDIFQQAFVSSDFGVKKPVPSYFEKVHAALGAEPDQIVFIDDSQRNVAAATAMGWRAIHYQDESSLGKIPRP
ncbi:MAG: HAD-IA family hydrolase [Chloroflexi bacterium]|nr:HAD-IA family hydrolase [Chloroflexota bacterium]MDA1226771.1 HAD-IA family hydrolase [Chloroflexota bacterium]